ncbi:conserved Plasmodium protein, unknown function [Plasmodium malariae]|uniref:Uncharacterized protein n=1 Tax=Plasmodium malariae TaxID=5858 RepID=A0A1C3L0Y4_PLAMA|nr:conserved Plasmodium protein, unknown function [Plasmodium malariae]
MEYRDDANKHEEIVYFYQWVEALTNKSKKKDISFFIHGLYNVIYEEGNEEEQELTSEHLKEKKNSSLHLPISSCSYTIYEKLCSGIRYFEMVIQQNGKRGDEEMDLNISNKELSCLCGERNLYLISDLLQQISVFCMKNKNEMIILSFLQHGGGSERDKERGTENSRENDNNKNRKGSNIGKTQEDDPAGNSPTTLIMQALDIYIYLYLRDYLKYSEKEENYNVLYFYNDKERIINLSKYNFNIDHFDIREWVFNNMSLLLPSKRIEEVEADEVYAQKWQETNTISPVDRIKKRGGPSILSSVGRTQERGANTLSLPRNTQERGGEIILSDGYTQEKSSSNLSQHHHLSLFRLNSMTSEKTQKSSCKIEINKKLPNIILGNHTKGVSANFINTSAENNNNLYINGHNNTTVYINGPNNNSGNINDSNKNGSNYYNKHRHSPDERPPNSNNSTLHYLKYSNEDYDRATLHTLSTYDCNLNACKQFIGHYNLSLTSYVVDVSKKMVLHNSPFIFTKKKLKYLPEQSYKKEFAHISKNNDCYYVVKIEKEDIQNVLSYIHKNIDKKICANFVSVLTANLSVSNIFKIVRINLKRAMN